MSNSLFCLSYQRLVLLSPLITPIKHPVGRVVHEYIWRGVSLSQRMEKLGITLYSIATVKIHSVSKPRPLEQIRLHTQLMCWAE